jgi:CubicO group peptidase (beta-lactamase class C family)
MTQDQVPEDALFKYWGSNSLGLGYGLGVAMQMDVRHAPYLGFVGDYAWGGALDTHWLVSPKTGLVAVLLTQIDPSGNKEPQRTDTDFRDLLFAAVTAGRGID